MAVALDPSSQPLIPWSSYLSFFCLRQGHQPLGKFLTLFQAAAAEVLLPDPAKLAALKVALDLTGANLPPWSKPALLLSDLIQRLQSFTSSSNNPHPYLSTQNLLLPALALFLPHTISKDAVSLQNSPAKTINQSLSLASGSKPLSLTELEKSTTRYKLKWINDSTASTPSTNVLCILDTDIAQLHAHETSPIDDDDTSHYASLQNLSSPICQSLMTIGGMVSLLTTTLMIHSLIIALAQVLLVPQWSMLTVTIPPCLDAFYCQIFWVC
ncbi:hypothetical protein DSO57_1020730 [Entomophthora muscae]|uniref:Uncharacterized protein n=1 Tax=Entomophthora muscae TaxID=34485 RepID=A0ACC2UPG4_9FUNG|nr:hypothetical protein DSO57_1020730 [Entomophthora muscae]